MLEHGERAAGQRRLHRDAQLMLGLQKNLANAVGHGRQRDTVVLKRLQRYGVLFLGQRMIGRSDDAHRLALMRVRANLRVGGRVENQADVRLILHHLTNHFVAAADVHDQLDSRVQLGKSGQRLRQTFKKAFPGHQRYRAAVQAFKRLNRIQQHFLLSQPLAVIGQHLVSRFRGLDPTAMALQQRRAEFLFQLGDLPAHRRRRDV
ncbi:hypothetical protein ALP75_205250 [Pseudomonas syringae pv. actinidiae]|nr:hypothetical protein ALP75_205250 [Pseudomonas syringae pv. actinidiae]